MYLLKLALTFTTATLLLSCTSQFPIPLARSEDTSASLPPPLISNSLKAAIEELRVMKIKIEEPEGISFKEYGEDLVDLADITKNATGDPKALAATKSAVEGHQLALQFWRCDRVDGYEALYQCRDKVLKRVFVKYPDIAAQANAAVAGEKVSYISAGLEKDSVLQAIWQKAIADTDVAVQIVNPPPLQKK
jgi:hypothetical protein